jgi:hypothetical protein
MLNKLILQHQLHHQLHNQLHLLIKHQQMVQTLL